MAAGEFFSSCVDYSPDVDPGMEQMLTLAMKQFSLDKYIPNADVPNQSESSTLTKKTNSVELKDGVTRSPFHYRGY